jgi:hypothetical protein
LQTQHQNSRHSLFALFFSFVLKKLGSDSTQNPLEMDQKGTISEASQPGDLFQERTSHRPRATLQNARQILLLARRRSFPTEQVGNRSSSKVRGRWRAGTHCSARKMSWISPSICSSSGVMGTPLAMVRTDAAEVPARNPPTLAHRRAPHAAIPNGGPVRRGGIEGELRFGWSWRCGWGGDSAPRAWLQSPEGAEGVVLQPWV